MRPVSLFVIGMICLAILGIDILAFYWLQSITDLISSSKMVKAIHIAFWIFTFGLITAIIILKIRLDDINPLRKQRVISSIYGLTISSFIPKVIFVVVISVLYFTNFMFVEEESIVVVPIIGLLSGVFPFLVILWGIGRTRYNFKIHHVHLRSNVVPRAFDETTIVQISDLHLGSFAYRYQILERAVNLINHLKPDYIVFTGDLVNNFAWELRGWDIVLKKLEANYGKYAVMGNHDYGDYSRWDSDKEKEENLTGIQDFFKEIGFDLLLNTSRLLNKNGSEMAIIGVENWGEPPFKQYGDLNKAMKTVEHIKFKILLSHDPSHWNAEILNRTDVFLTLSGHTHGMQAGIENRFVSWSPIQYRYKQWGGLYQAKDQYLYVNRGLGWLGFPGRLGIKPEITSIHLSSS